MDENTYQSIGQITDQLPFPETESKRLKYREIVLAVYEYFGVTEDEWIAYLEKKLDERMNAKHD